MKINFEEIKDYKTYIVLFITLFQFILFICMNIDNKEETISILSKPDKPKITIVNDELNKVEKLKILKIEDLNDKLDIRVAICGERKNLLKALNELNSFHIYNYNLDGNNDELLLTLDLYR